MVPVFIQIPLTSYPAPGGISDLPMLQPVLLAMDGMSFMKDSEEKIMNVAAKRTLIRRINQSVEKSFEGVLEGEGLIFQPLVIRQNEDQWRALLVRPPEPLCMIDPDDGDDFNMEILKKWNNSTGIETRIFSFHDDELNSYGLLKRVDAIFTRGPFIWKEPGGQVPLLTEMALVREIKQFEELLPASCLNLRTSQVDRASGPGTRI